MISDDNGFGDTGLSNKVYLEKQMLKSFTIPLPPTEREKASVWSR